MRQAVLSLALLSLLAAGVARAGPAKWAVAINASSHECAGYWAGDEFTHYALPAGWTAYFDSVDGGAGLGCPGSALGTALGACCYVAGAEEACCKQLGLKYVASNIGALPSSSGDGGASSSSGGGCSCSSAAPGSPFAWPALLVLALLAVARLQRVECERSSTRLARLQPMLPAAILQQRVDAASRDR
jgi:MYXO-CTERM domain-containing protein